MTTRESILAAVRQNKPQPTPLPPLDELAERASAGMDQPPLAQFCDVLTSIGGQGMAVNGLADVAAYVSQHYGGPGQRVVTTLPGLGHWHATAWLSAPVHELASVDLMVLEAQFGVAENGAVWLTDAQMGQRAAPFIAQHLAVVLSVGALVGTMHEAYQRLGAADYGFGVFIAGPSKTADIEQSLVLGAHGPKSMTVFLLP